MPKLTITELYEWRTKFAEVYGTMEAKTLAAEFAKEFDFSNLKGFEIYELLRGSRSFFQLLRRVIE